MPESTNRPQTISENRIAESRLPESPLSSSPSSIARSCILLDSHKTQLPALQSLLPPASNQNRKRLSRTVVASVEPTTRGPQWPLNSLKLPPGLPASGFPVFLLTEYPYDPFICRWTLSLDTPPTLDLFLVRILQSTCRPPGCSPLSLTYIRMV